MANDRMYIRCKGCGKAMMIAKHFLSPWGAGSYEPGWGLDDLMNVFFRDHYMCGSSPDEHNFDLVYEDDEYTFVSHSELARRGEEMAEMDKKEREELMRVRTERDEFYKKFAEMNPTVPTFSEMFEKENDENKKEKKEDRMEETE